MRGLSFNTLLQRSVEVWPSGHNRLSGFPHGAETVETVLSVGPAYNTPLKQGVTEKVTNVFHLVCETIRFADSSQEMVMALYRGYERRLRRIF